MQMVTGQLDVEMRRLTKAGGSEGLCSFARSHLKIMELRGAVRGRLHAARCSSWVKLHRSGWMGPEMDMIFRFPGHARVVCG